MTQAQWRWGPDWDEAIRAIQKDKDEDVDKDSDELGMKYADLALYCGSEVVLPVGIDHWAFLWDADHELFPPSAEHRAFIVRACNCHNDLVAALKAALPILWAHRCDGYVGDKEVHRCSEVIQACDTALATAKR